MEFTFSELCETVAFTGLYRQVFAQLTKVNVLLSKEDFCRKRFGVLVDCDDMLKIAASGKPLNLIMATPAPANGLRQRVYRQ